MFRFILSLTLTCITSSSFALGLSDIALKSNLGEFLDASVTISDVDAAPDLSCFLVKEMPGETALKRISVRLVESNQKHQLNISTGVIVSEPIVNLTVNYVCDPNFSRSYVLLLDPAPLPTAVASAATENTTSGNESSNVKADTSRRKATVKPQDANQQSASKAANTANNAAGTDTTTNTLVADSASTDTASNDAPAIKPPPKKAKKPKAKKANNLALGANETSADAKLMEAYVGKTTNQSQATQKSNVAEKQNKTDNNAKPTSAKPYLVISGGTLNGGAPYDSVQTGLTLQLETEIDFNRVAEPPLVPSNEETLDEVTVMANRLAHLEKQILSLQSTNLKLKAQVIEAENTGFRLSPTQQHWLHYAGIILGILALIAIIEFARRQFLRHRLKRDEAIWFIDNDAENDLVDDDLDNHFDALSTGNHKINAAGANSENAFNQAASQPAQQFDDPILNASKASQPAATAIPTNTKSAAEQEVENVLDHADVFIAHGRTNLAIQLLQNHLEEFPTESPAVWLKLLGLLAAENSESDYDVAVTECNQFFNIKLPSYAEALNEDESSIENHPHIVSRLEGVWGSQYAIGFLNDLIYNQQSQPREGFARNTFEELFFLRQISEILQSDVLPEGTTNVYRAESVQPALEKVAVNTALFASVTPINPAVSNAADENTPALNPSNNTEMHIASFAADEFEDGFSNEDTDEIDILLETDPVEAVTVMPVLEDSITHTTTTSAPIISDSQSLPEIVFASEDEQNMVENLHFEAVTDADTPTNTTFDDDAITEEIDFSSVDSATEDLTLETPLLAEDDDNVLAFDESAFKEISDAVKASMLEKSADELSEADNSNMIEFDWDLPDAAETPPNAVKTSKKPTK